MRRELGVSPCQSWGEAGLFPSVMVVASFSLCPSLFWDGEAQAGFGKGKKPTWKADQGKLVLGSSAEPQCWACLGWKRATLLCGGSGAPHVPPELPWRWMGWLCGFQSCGSSSQALGAILERRVFGWLPLSSGGLLPKPTHALEPCARQGQPSPS